VAGVARPDGPLGGGALVIRHWTAPGVAGVLAAVLTACLVRAVPIVLHDGFGASVVTVPGLWLLYAAGPAVLCAVPLVVLSRAVLARTAGSVGVYAALGVVGGLVVGVVQTWVLLSTWPWQQPGDVVWNLVAIPVLGGLVGGVVAGLVRRRRDAARPD